AVLARHEREMPVVCHGACNIAGRIDISHSYDSQFVIDMQSSQLVTPTGKLRGQWTGAHAGSEDCGGTSETVAVVEGHRICGNLDHLAGETNFDTCFGKCPLDHWPRLCTEIRRQHARLFDKHDARSPGDRLTGVNRNSAAHFGRELDTCHTRTDDHKGIVAGFTCKRCHVLQVTIEGYRPCVAVDVEGILSKAWYGWAPEFATGCQDQSIIAERRTSRGLVLNHNEPGRNID